MNVAKLQSKLSVAIVFSLALVWLLMLCNH